MNPGFLSYTLAAVAYGLLTLLLVFGVKRSKTVVLLILITAGSALWAALAALQAVAGWHVSEAYRFMEGFRYVLWYLFLLKLFDTGITQSSYTYFANRAMLLAVGLALLVLLDSMLNITGEPVFVVIGQVLLALIGLAIVEQLFRNLSPAHTWAVKYLAIGAGGLFAFDFYMYAEVLLFRNMDESLWQARGVLHLFAVPLIALSVLRQGNWSSNLFVSRDIVLHSTAILGGGIYLLIMAAAGYYLREYGGSWGRVGQIVFLSLAVALLAAILLSGQLRSQLRVFLGKHFYANKYDYRQEWLQLTDDLSAAAGDRRFEAVIEAFARLVEARSGLLWLDDGHGHYHNVAAWKARPVDRPQPRVSRFTGFMEETGYVINLHEISAKQREYQGCELPQWLDEVYKPWLVVPLFGLQSLTGFVVLADPLIKRDINWEDRDLLKTAARQIASHLIVLTTSDALAEARQFEVFSRLSAYMVHDLKNIAYELGMVARNARRHMDNPEFLQDAFATVDNAAAGINRLLEQLRNKRMAGEKTVVVDLNGLLDKVVAGKQAARPAPVFVSACDHCYCAVEKNRLANVIAHLIDNAQQATPDSGRIEVALAAADGMCEIRITDNGAGMDREFIRTRLFKPFDTTKGNAGMGIGMYESRDFIRQSGGDIHVHSTPGAGTTVTLSIPAVPPDGADSES